MNLDTFELFFVKIYIKNSLVPLQFLPKIVPTGGLSTGLTIVEEETRFGVRSSPEDPKIFPS